MPGSGNLLASGFERVQFFAGLETDRFAGGDADPGSRAGVASDACFARPDAEDAESAQLNALAGRQGLLEAFEDRVHGRFRLCAGQASALNHLMNDVLFDQWCVLAGANFNAASVIVQILR